MAKFNYMGTTIKIEITFAKKLENSSVWEFLAAI